MVLNVGVFPFWGNVTTYDSETQKIEKFDVVPVKEDESSKIENMLKEIVTKINHQELGCICFAMGYSYLNDIRKALLQSAINHGFKKAEIIAGKQARYIGMVSKSGIIPKDGDIIWSLAVWESNIICDVWEKRGSKAVYMVNYGQSKTNQGKDVSPTAEDFRKLYDKIDLEKEPDIIFAEGFVDEFEIAKAFPNCKLSKWKEGKHEWTEYALIKAHIMDDDNEVVDFDADGVLQRAIEFVVNNEDSVIRVEEFTPLPIDTVVSFETTEVERISMKVFERHNVVDVIPLPSKAEVNIYFAIDNNGIFSYHL